MKNLTETTMTTRQKLKFVYNNYYKALKLKDINADYFKRKITKINEYIYSNQFIKIVKVNKIDNFTYIVYEYNDYNNIYEIHTMNISKDGQHAERSNIRKSKNCFRDCFDIEATEAVNTFNDLFQC